MSDKHDDSKFEELVGALSATPVYRVLLLANLIGQPFFSRFGKRFSMTLNEWRIMIALSANRGISVSEICEKSGLHIMNVSRGVKGLERQGRVVRRVDPNDRRRTLLELSDDGAALFQAIAPQGLAWADTVCEVLTAEETAAFDCMLDKLIDQARAKGGG